MIAMILTFVFVPFLGTGIIKKIRARAQMRRGPSLFQPCFDLWRTLKKAPIDGPFSGEYAEIAPLLSAAAGIAIWSLVVFRWASPLWLIPFLAVQFIAITTFAVETGTSFGGLGASREILLTNLAKPTLLVVLIFFEATALKSPLACFLAILFCLIAFVAILAETAKPPFDDPRTHLELTMVHEAMLLEASGNRLAFFEIGSIFKMAGLLMLLSRLLMRSVSPLFPWLELSSDGAALAGTFGLFVFIGGWEATSVRRKWTWVPETLGLTFLTAVLLVGLMALSRI